MEVDVVAQQGLAWIEVKAHEPFDLDSSHWLGNPGHFKGLLQQAQQQLEVAKAACNVVRWQSPSVIFHLPLGVHPAVKAELSAMGVLVSGPGRFDVSILPAMPAAPDTVNMDVTTLCALVSEVSNGDAFGADLQQWAQQVTHWQDCLAAEQQNPMLPILQPFLDRQRLVAAHAAVQQFEKLLEQFGGSKERQRWQTWRSKLQIYSSDQLLGTPQLIEHSSQNRFSSHEISLSMLQDRVPALQAISAAQKEVFAVGDCLHALTLSANSKATEFAARQGVQLEVFIHRAVWLTGK